INLFNLFPVSPLDGGRIVTVLSTKIWFIGLLALIPVLFISPDPIMILIFIFGIITWWNQYKDNGKMEIMEHEESVLGQVNDGLKQIVGYPYSRGSADTITLKNKLTYRHDEIKKNLSATYSKYAFPIVQEKERNRRKKLEKEKEILSKTMNTIQNYELSLLE